MWSGKCSLCGGPGPFDTTEEVMRKTKGACTWTTVCKWCDIGKDGCCVYVKDRPTDLADILKGPQPHHKRTKVTA